MTVSEQSTRRQVNGPIAINASVPTIMRFIDNSHIKATVLNADGTETNWVYGSQYTVSGANTDSGTLTPLVAVASDAKLTIYMDVPYIQEIDYVEAGKFPANTHERGLDKAMLIAQQLKEQNKLALKLPITSASNIDTVMETPKPGHAVIWNDTGTRLVNSDSPLNSVVSDSIAIYNNTVDVYDNTVTVRNAAQTAQGAAETARNAAQAAQAAAETARDQAQSIQAATQTIKDSALTEVGNAKTDAITAVNGARDTALADVQVASMINAIIFG